MGRRAAQTTGWLRAFLLGGALVGALATPAVGVELVGTWHVLVHYKDSAAAHPERERWEDRIWEFSMQGDRLQWVDYPIVVFEDPSGRFERLGTNRASRVLHHWEPNEGQLAQIRRGLEINPRGSRTKLLRARPGGGWSSGDGRSAYRSARFITFTETWTIEGPPDRPVFTIEDVLGSAATESLEGRTRYQTETVDDGTGVIRGRYDRDGTRGGTFRMMRTGATSVVKGSSARLGERVTESFFGEVGRSLYHGEVPAEFVEESMREAIAAGTFDEDDRRELRLFFESKLGEQWKKQGNDPSLFRREIQSVARQMVTLFVDDGRSMQEIREMLTDGRLRP